MGLPRVRGNPIRVVARKEGQSETTKATLGRTPRNTEVKPFSDRGINRVLMEAATDTAHISPTEVRTSNGIRSLVPPKFSNMSEEKCGHAAKERLGNMGKSRLRSKSKLTGVYFLLKFRGTSEIMWSKRKLTGVYLEAMNKPNLTQRLRQTRGANT